MNMLLFCRVNIQWPVIRSLPPIPLVDAGVQDEEGNGKGSMSP